LVIGKQGVALRGSGDEIGDRAMNQAMTSHGLPPAN
jgi:hypothetical protein